MQSKLNELYERYRSAPSQAVRELAPNFFAPLLLSLPDDWVGASHRLAFVGQETLGWQWTREHSGPMGYELTHPDVHSLEEFFDLTGSTDALVDGYRQFDFASRQPVTHRSPFWRYFREAKNALMVKGESTSAVFTNVIRCAVDAESGFTLWSMSSDEREAYLSWQHGILLQELRIIQPTLIIFVSGPNYDGYLRRELGDLTFDPVPPATARVAARVSGSALTAPAYRTYHPGYLNRNGKLGLGFAPIRSVLEHAGLV